MLETYKKTYKEIADSRIPNWNKQSKSDLIRNYCKAREEKNEYLENAYISAIMLKYWGAISNQYRMPRSARVYETDCYDWLTEAILDMTKRHDWDKPNLVKTYAKTGEVRVKPNPLYGKEDGPNMAVTQCITSMRLGFYQSANYDKRKLNYNAASIDEIIDNKQSYILPRGDKTEDILTNSLLKDWLQEDINNKNYGEAFIIDGIINGDVFEISKNNPSFKFNKKKLAKHIRNIPKNYYKIMASNLDLDQNELLEISKKYASYDSVKIYKFIDEEIKSIKNKISRKLGVEVPQSC